jgi:hypothetical protein
MNVFLIYYFCVLDQVLTNSNYRRNQTKIIWVFIQSGPSGLLRNTFTFTFTILLNVPEDLTLLWHHISLRIVGSFRPF